MADVPDLCDRLRAFHSKIMNEAATALEQEVENWKRRNRDACAAEAKLAEAIEIISGLIILERGSGEKALDFLKRHGAIVGSVQVRGGDHE